MPDRIMELESELEYLEKKNILLQEVIIKDLIERLSKYETIDKEQLYKIYGINNGKDL